VPSIHCFIFELNKEFSFEEAIERSRDRGLKSSIISKMEDYYTVRIGIRTSSLQGFFIPIDEHWMFVSEGESSRVSQIIKSFSKGMFPILNLIYLPSSSILEMIDRVKRKYDSIEVVEGTMCKTGETFRTWKKKPIEFSIETMIEMAKREDAKWTGISLRFRIDEENIFGCRLNENGHLSIYSGDFLEFYADALLPYINASEQVRSLLKNRERKEADNRVILSPLSLNFETSISKSEVQLIEKRIVSNYAAAVMHPGNPMLLMQVCDRGDGSLYDLYVFNKKIEIVPLHKASPDSIENLVSLISNTLPMGTLVW